MKVINLQKRSRLAEVKAAKKASKANKSANQISELLKSPMPNWGSVSIKLT